MQALNVSLGDAKEFYFDSIVFFLIVFFVFVIKFVDNQDSNFNIWNDRVLTHAHNTLLCPQWIDCTQTINKFTMILGERNFEVCVCNNDL